MGSLAGEEAYAAECFEFVKVLGIQDVVFTGQVNVKEYLGRMDFTILTSISEGQPLVVLESFAAKKPVIATNVGNCKGLLYGEDDGIGPAGILTHMINVEEIEQAILKLASDPELCLRMGENGYRRVLGKYNFPDMHNKYAKIYQDFAGMADLERNSRRK